MSQTLEKGMLFAGMAADAQLKVNSTGKVGIATKSKTSYLSCDSEGRFIMQI